jgi:hypothetical protein
MGRRLMSTFTIMTPYPRMGHTNADSIVSLAGQYNANCTRTKCSKPLLCLLRCTYCNTSGLTSGGKRP